VQDVLDISTWVLLACTAASLCVYALGLWSVVKHRSLVPPTVPDDALPPVSMLKPIKGVEEAMEENLRTFFEQDYPASFEIVFASTEDHDPGIDLARTVAASYPHVPVRFVKSDPRFGLNPKVGNLAGALAAASHDVVLQSDANVRVGRDYLRRVVAEMQTYGASLVTSMVTGVGERSIGAALENLQLSAFIGPGMCTALHGGGVHCVVGKSMLFRKSELREVGGLELVRDILCEDFILGREYGRRGKRVHLSATTVQNVNERIPVSRFVARHSRWLKMRVVIHLGGWFADIGSNPPALLALALATSLGDPRIAIALAAAVPLKAAGDAFMMKQMRGRALPFRYLWLAPVRDAVMGVLFFYSAFSRSVVWRGKKLRFGKDSRLLVSEDTRAELGLHPVSASREKA
jgi:ceramide glucosyltransferase